MPSLISRWIFSRVVRSALAFETESIDIYHRLADQLGGQRSCRDDFRGALCHLLEEEQMHWKLLTDAAEGKLTLEELEGHLSQHVYPGLEEMESLGGGDLERWGQDLARALDQEEKTWVFYGNLRRMSKLPVVKKTFEVLAAMEKEHIDILRRLLGRTGGAEAGKHQQP
jgi:rubrerythrin